MMKKLLRLATLALLFTGMASAQSTGSITGVVTDGATGKPVVGALVVATSPAVPGQQTAVTDAKGSFTISGLPAGQYKLQASFDGYKLETRSDLALGENVNLRANLAIVPEAVQLEEVVVTGSRIKRKDLTGPAPVTVVSKEQMNTAGKVSLGEFLKSMPEQGLGNNAQVNNGSDGSVTVDLRTLGASRTLVLVNGRRFVGGGAGDFGQGTPDLGSIPTAAIERVEILKDGASAVYGSDAIAGVVNVILKKRFNGTEVSAFGGTSSRNDGSQMDFSAVTGAGNEKGNFLVSVGYTKMKGIRSADRSWAETTYSYGPWDYYGDPTAPPGWYATGNSGTFPNGRFTLPASACVAPTTPEAIQACAASGGAGGVGMVPTPTGPGTATFTPYDNSLYNTNPTTLLITPSDRIQFFSTGDGNLGNVARIYYEASYTKRNSESVMAPMPLVNNTIPTNPVVVSANSIYNPFGVNITSWRKRTTEFGDRSWASEAVTFRTVLGLDGSIGDWAGPLRGWGWDVSYNYGNNAATQFSSGQLRMPNVANATGPSMIYNGQPICVRVPGDPTTKINGCVPMDVLHGAGNIAGTGNLAALKTYVSFDGYSRGYTDQQIASASLNGELFRLMSDRPVGLAIGVDRRYESGGNTPDIITMALESSGNNQLATKGSYTATEAFAELSLPIINKIPFAEELEASLAARTVNYSNFGTNTTFKVGARYTPVKDVTLRGTYSTALRAPSVSDLYGGAYDTYPQNRDPCRTLSATSPPLLIARCEASGVTVASGGTHDPSVQLLGKVGSNPDLKPETAKIFTAGVVIEPRWVPNLSMTVDYYNIQLRDAITSHGISGTLTNCYSGDGSLCANVVRDPVTHLITNVNDFKGNLAGTDTAGIDVAIRYALPTDSFGRFTVGGDATFLQYYKNTDAKGKDPTDVAGTAGFNDDPLPKVKATAALGWSTGGFNVGTDVRYIGNFTEACPAGYCAADELTKKVGTYTTFNVNAGYHFKTTAGTTSLLAGIQNVGDTKPNFLYWALSANTNPYLYDYVGRYYYARVTQTF